MIYANCQLFALMKRRDREIIH